MDPNGAHKYIDSYFLPLPLYLVNPSAEAFVFEYSAPERTDFGFCSIDSSFAVADRPGGGEKGCGHPVPHPALSPGENSARGNFQTAMAAVVTKSKFWTANFYPLGNNISKHTQIARRVQFPSQSQAQKWRRPHFSDEFRSTGISLSYHNLLGKTEKGKLNVEGVFVVYVSYLPEGVAW